MLRQLEQAKKPQLLEDATQVNGERSSPKQEQAAVNHHENQRKVAVELEK
jgi:hypothetical protein